MNTLADKSGQVEIAVMPPRPRRTGVRWLLLVLALLVSASFVTLDLRFGEFLEPGAISKIQEFVSGFFPPLTEKDFLQRLAQASLETVAMSLVGTALAVILSIGLAAAAAKTNHQAGYQAGHQSGARRLLRSTTRFILIAMRSVPELVWASLLIIAAGLGPFPGTLALALHTTGVLGRLFADSLENIPPVPAQALRANGTPALAVFAYATLPLALPQMLSYTLYRWENNIRAATVLGVVGAGGLGQLLYYHLSLFHMQEASSVIIAMLLLVALVDAVSFTVRRQLNQ